MDENPVEEQETSPQNRKRTGWLEKDYPGCARWGCITTVVGFGLMVFVSSAQLPSPRSVQINFAKTTIWTIIKECLYSEARNPGANKPSDSESSTIKLRGYKLSVGPTCFTATAEPNDGSLPELSFSYNNETGTATKTCIASEHPYGCYTDKDLTIKQEPGMAGYW